VGAAKLAKSAFSAGGRAAAVGESPNPNRSPSAGPPPATGGAAAVCFGEKPKRRSCGGAAAVVDPFCATPTWSLAGAPAGAKADIMSNEPASVGLGALETGCGDALVDPELVCSCGADCVLAGEDAVAELRREASLPTGSQKNCSSCGGRHVTRIFPLGKQCIQLFDLVLH